MLIVVPAVIPSRTKRLSAPFPGTVTNYLVKSNLKWEGFASLTFEDMVHHREEVHHKGGVCGGFINLRRPGRSMGLEP